MGSTRAAKSARSENLGEIRLRQSGVRIAQGALAFSLLFTAGDVIRTAAAFLPVMADGWNDFVGTFGPIFIQEFALAFAGAALVFAMATAASFGLAREFAGKAQARPHADACTKDAVPVLAAWGFTGGAALAFGGWGSATPGMQIVTALASLAVLLAATYRLTHRLQNVHGFEAKNAAFAALPFVVPVAWLLWNAVWMAVQPLS